MDNRNFKKSNSQRPRNNENRHGGSRGVAPRSSDENLVQTLKNKINELEEEIKILKQNLEKNGEKVGLNHDFTTSFIDSDKDLSTLKIPPKFEAVLTTDYTAVCKDLPDIKVKIGEKDLVDNQIILGDSLLIEVHKDFKIKTVKVAQKVKRAEVDSLVIQKGSDFYAVSKFATHKLINYEVQSKAILKGFDATLLLPEGHEKDSYFALVKFIEGASQVEQDVFAKSHKKPSYDPRVIEADDLV